jgi:hypothetical protein
VSLRPPLSFPLRPLIAALPSETLLIVTNPKPRDWPVSRSVISLTSETVPNGSKSSLSVRHVKGKISDVKLHGDCSKADRLPNVRCKLGRFIPISEPFLNRKTCEVAILPAFFHTRDQSHFFPGVSDLGPTTWVKMSGFRNLGVEKGSRGCLNLHG